MTDQQLNDYLSTIEKVKFDIPKIHNVQKIKIEMMRKITKQ